MTLVGHTFNVMRIGIIDKTLSVVDQHITQLNMKLLIYQSSMLVNCCMEIILIDCCCEHIVNYLDQN